MSARQSTVRRMKQQAAVFTVSVKHNSNYCFYAVASLFTALAVCHEQIELDDKR